jgi:hypothetical protein
MHDTIGVSKGILKNLIIHNAADKLPLNKNDLVD